MELRAKANSECTRNSGACDDDESGLSSSPLYFFSAPALCAFGPNLFTYSLGVHGIG
jgi:hypothetical protein